MVFGRKLDYKVKIEQFRHLARTVVIIKSNTDYKRKEDWETEDTSINIMEVNMESKFPPLNNFTQTEHFSTHLT